jgi:O-antigen/teichoic acid export membrane protein
MGSVARRWISRQLDEPLFRAAYSLMANSVITAALGIAYWAVAARVVPSAALGEDGALITAMITLSTICQLNMSNAIARFLPSTGAASLRSLALAYLVGAGASFVGGVIFVLMMPLISDGFAFLSEDPLLALTFPVGAAVWALFVMQDAALAALRQAPWVPVENTVFGLAKLAALPVLVATTSHGTFVAWVLGAALLVVPVNWFVFTRAVPEHVRTVGDHSRAEARADRGLVSFLAQDYVATVLNLVAVTLLPLVVLAVLGSEQSAYFFIPFSIMLAVELFVHGATTSLLVEGARVGADVVGLTRSLLRRIGPIVIASVLILVLAAPLVLAPFGSDYAQEGTPVLRLLALAALFHAVTILFATISRLQRRGSQILVVYLGWFVLQAALAYALASSHGIEGVAFGWMVANAAIAVGLSPWLIRFTASRSG